MSVSTGVPVAPASRAAELPRGLTALLLLTLALAPLPLASNRPPFEGLLAMTAAAGLILWGWHFARTGQGLLLEWQHLRAPALCVTLVLLWVLIQLLPLPASLARPVWQETASLLEQPLAGHITIDVSATRSGLIRLAGTIGFFALAFQLGRSTRMAGRLLRILFMASCAYAAYGLLAYAAGNDYVLWLPKDSYTDSLTGTYVNRNAFAALCGMGLLAGLTLLVRQLSREMQGYRAAAQIRQLLRRIWPVLASCLILVMALWLTSSRAGIVSCLIGALVMAGGIRRSGLLPARLLLGGLLGALLLLGSLLAFHGDQMASRFAAAEFAEDERPDIWRSTIRMIADAPLTGQGLGTYDQLFHAYRTDNTWRIYDHAHNSYLEMAAGLGIPAALLWFAALGLIGLRLWQGTNTRRQNQYYPVFGLSVLAMAASHALLDFSYQIPANAVWLAVILGMTTAQSFRTGEQGR